MIDISAKALKSGIYKMNDIVSDNIIIGEGENVIIIDFDSKNGVNKITLCENSKLEYYGIYLSDGKFGVDIVAKGNNSNTAINILNLLKNTDISIDAIASLDGNNNTSYIYIISLGGENGAIKINSGINISKNTTGCSGNILQENVFLGENGKIIGIPALNIETSEAKANHALKIEKINEKDLFYLESRGIDKKNATRLIFESKINTLFTKISKEYGPQIDEYTNDFLK